MRASKMKTIGPLLITGILGIVFSAHLITSVDSDHIPGKVTRYIVQADSVDQAIKLVNRTGATISHELPIIDSVAAYLTEDQLARLNSSEKDVHIFVDTMIETASRREDKKRNRRSKRAARRGGLDKSEAKAIAKSLRREAKEEIRQLRLGFSENATKAEKDDLESRIKALKAHWEMKIRRPFSAKGVPQSAIVRLIDADSLHSTGITGVGIGVAILDTGLWIDRAINKRNGFNEPVAEYNAIKDKEGKVDDKHGHGTHLASVIASRDFGPLREANGIAPDAELIIVKGFDQNGQGSYADIIRGLNWIVENRVKYNIRVLNLSFSAPPKSAYWDDPLNLAVMAAWNAGIVVVVSAGNTGPDPMSIGVPGNIPYVITIGALTDSYTTEDRSDDVLISFSATGPTHEGFVKPDLIAPGCHVSGIMGKKSTLALLHPDFHDDERYFMMSGTSHSAAVVTGVVALMLQYQGDINPNDVKCRLLASSRVATDASGDLAYSVFQQGAGSLNAHDAIFSFAEGCANTGLNISADLSGSEHFMGPARQDANGEFYLEGFGVGDSAFTWDGS
jgi:subtilisin family serine protease